MENMAMELMLNADEMVFDIRDFLLDQIKARPKPWSGTSQAEQRDVAAACEVSAKELVRKVAEHIASNGVPAVRILLTNFSMGGTDMKIAGKEIGRATCRERVCQYVSISGVAVSLKKKKKNIS